LKLTEYVSLRIEVVQDFRAFTVELGLVPVLFGGHPIGHTNYNKINWVVISFVYLCEKRIAENCLAS